MVITGRIRAPFKIAFRGWELSLLLLIIGCLTAEPGDYFKADLVTRFTFFGLQYVAVTAMFAWSTARLFQLSGFPIPFILCYCFLTLLAIPDVFIPVCAAISPAFAAGASFFWMMFTLFAFSRAIRTLIPISKSRLLLVMLAGLILSDIVNLGALQFAVANDWINEKSFVIGL